MKTKKCHFQNKSKSAKMKFQKANQKITITFFMKELCLKCIISHSFPLEICPIILNIFMECIQCNLIFIIAKTYNQICTILTIIILKFRSNKDKVNQAMRNDKKKKLISIIYYFTYESSFDMNMKEIFESEGIHF